MPRVRVCGGALQLSDDDLVISSLRYVCLRILWIVLTCVAIARVKDDGVGPCRYPFLPILARFLTENGGNVDAETTC